MELKLIYVESQITKMLSPQLLAHVWDNMSKESRAQVEKTQKHRIDYDGELMYVDAAGDQFSNISPSEAFKGREVDFKKDLRVGLGDYAEAMDPYPTIWCSARLKA